MKKITIILALLLFAGFAHADTKSLRFAYNHDGIDVAKFTLYSSETSGGPYVKVTDISYIPGGTSFISNVPFTVPAGTDRTYYFVMTASDAAGNESGLSNEASARIDLKPPETVFDLTVEIVIE